MDIGLQGLIVLIVRKQSGKVRIRCHVLFGQDLQDEQDNTYRSYRIQSILFIPSSRRDSLYAIISLMT